MKEDLVFDFANSADLPQISRIERACFSVPWNDESLLFEIHNPISVFLVARTKNGICGYISAQNICGDCYIGNLAVAPESRRRGVGEALLREMIRILKRDGAAFVSLEVRTSNTAARGLYDKIGFLPVGERKNYYSSPTENAVIYTLNFEESAIDYEDPCH